MLTVRIKYPNNRERIVEANSLTVDCLTESNLQQINLFKRNGTFESVDIGDIFVMNENGKTVASYYLGDNKVEAKESKG